MCKIYEYVIDMHITVLENNIVTRQLGFTNLDEKAHLCQPSQFLLRLLCRE